jgi:hypothetical protein
MTEGPFAVRTRHAEARCAKRSIPPLVAELILSYGTERPARDGASKYFLERRGLRKLRKEGGKAMADALATWQKLGAYVVADGPVIITAAYKR